MRTPGFSSKSASHWLLIAIVIVGAVLRFFGIERQPFSFGEALSLWFSQHSLHDLWTFVPIIELIPPLFSLLLKGWSVFGTDEFALRSLAAIIGISTIPLVYKLGELVGGNERGAQWGVAAALFFSVSPLHIEFAQVSRYTTALCFTVTLSLVAAAWLIRHPAAAQRVNWCSLMRSGDMNRHALNAWFVLALSVGVTLWLHSLAPVFVASLFMALLIWLLGIRAGRWRLFVNTVVAALVGIALWLPFLPMLLRSMAQVSEAFWMQAPTFRDLAEQLDFWFGVSHAHVLLSFPLAITAVLGLDLMRRRSQPTLTALILIMMIMPIALVLLASFLFRPLLVHRPLIAVSVPYYVLLAAGVTWFEHRIVRLALTVGITTVLLFGCYNYFTGYRTLPWDTVAELIASGSQPGDTIMVVPNGIELPVGYYLQRVMPNSEIFGLPGEFPSMDSPNPYPGDISSGPMLVAGDAARIRELTASGTTVWLIVWIEAIYDPEGVARRTLTDAGWTASEMRLAEELTVYQFMRQPPLSLSGIRRSADKDDLRNQGDDDGALSQISRSGARSAP